MVLAVLLLILFSLCHGELSFYTASSHRYVFGVSDAFLDLVALDGTLIHEESLFHASTDQVLFVASGEPSKAQLLVTTKKKAFRVSKQGGSWSKTELVSPGGQQIAYPQWWNSSQFIVRVGEGATALLDIEADSLKMLPLLPNDIGVDVVTDSSASLVYSLRAEHCGGESCTPPLLSIFSLRSSSVSLIGNVSLHYLHSSGNVLDVGGVLPRPDGSLLAFVSLGGVDPFVGQIDSTSGKISLLRTMSPQEQSLYKLTALPGKPDVVYGWSISQQSIYTFNASNLSVLSSTFIAMPKNGNLAQGVGALFN
jgi:hypothetical protein